MAEVLHATDWNGESDAQMMRICVVDPEGRLVGSPWGRQFGTAMQVPAVEQEGIETRSTSVAVFATARTVHDFDALGLRCMIEQTMASDEEIAAAVGPARRAG